MTKHLQSNWRFIPLFIALLMGFLGKTPLLAQNYSFTINVTPNPAEGGAVSGAGAYAEGAECTLTATAAEGYTFVNWTENGEMVSTENPYTFTVTGYRNLVANFVSESNTELGDTWYDWQSNSGPITRTVVWPDGKVNFAFTQALEEGYWDRGTGICTYDAVNNEWIASEGRVENEKTGFGSIARYGENGIVVAAHTAYDCRIYLISDKENIPYNSLEATSILDNTYEPYWPNVMTSGANRDIIHVIATASDADGWLYGSQVYFRSTDGGNTWDKQNVILPFMGPEDCGGWQSNSCYWMETTDDNCLALVVNNVWSDGMVIYSYDDGETWQRKVFYKHPNPFGSFDEPFFYPRWTSCQWDSQHHLHVLYELGAVSGDVSSYDGMMNENYALGGVAYWNEDMPYNLNGTSVSAIEGNLIPGQPFVMDSAYLSHDIYQSWWLLSDAPHEMWPEYLGYLTPLTDEGVPEDPYEAYEFNIIDGSLHGKYYHGVCGFPVLCTVPGTDEMVAVWSALDENHTDASGNYYYKIFASYSGDGGTTWSPMVHLTRNPEFDYSEFVYNQAVVVGRKLIIATQTDEETGTYVQGDENIGDNNYYRGFVFDIDELFDTTPPQEYTITVSADPADLGVVSGGGSYHYGSYCTLTATPNVGIAFTHWTKDGETVSEEPIYRFKVTGNVSYVAHFTDQAFTIAAIANPAEGGTIMGAGTIAEGQTCTLSATANTGYVFSGWTLEDGELISSTPTFSFTVTENASYVANFTALAVCQITVTANPSQGGSVSGGGSFYEGDECTLTAIAYEGYQFAYWSTEAVDIVSTNPTFSFTIAESASYVANFIGIEGFLGYTYYDWQSNSGPITRTVVWPDGKVNFAFTQALEEGYWDRGTGIGTYDAVNNEWIASEGRVENEKTGFGSIARYGENGIVVAAHTSTECCVYVISDKDNITHGTIGRVSALDPTNDVAWPNVMTSGANRDIIHVVGTSSNYNQQVYYFRSSDGGQTWDKKNVILPYMTSDYCLSWSSNSCYWMETTEDNCLALVVNDPWSDGMVIYSYDDGETWQRKVFYKHPNPFGSFEEPFYYPRWTSCQWDNQHHLHVLYALGAVSGTASNNNEHTALGGVAYWNEDMPYNLNGTSVSAIEGNLIPGQPFVMEETYLRYDIDHSWWHYSDPTHEMWPEYIGYLPPLSDNGCPEDSYQATSFNIEDLSLHGSYLSGVCSFPVLCMVPGTDEMVAVWSALDENHTDASGNYYYKIFASYSGDGGTTWSPMVHLTRNPEFDYSEFVYNQAVVVERKLIIATQTDEETGTYVQGDENIGDNNYYKGFVFDIDELFETSHQEVIAEGALNGVFSVGENATVRFSQGNLQYIGSAGNGDENNTGAYWKFAEHQWDYLGDNGQGSSSMTDDRDLFGWGTSDYNHGANCYQPWSTSTSNADYYPYGSYTYNLYDQTGQADWGYNAISNGGNQENCGWRTLTHEEWVYLFNTRSTSSDIRYAKAKVNNVNGVILLPDDWNASYYTLNNTNSQSASYTSNTITETQWATLEQHGAVFLPAAGLRDGTSVSNAGSYGCYWSSSYFYSYYAWSVYFYDSNFLADFNGNRYNGQSVRLVFPSQGYSFSIDASSSPAEGGAVSGAGAYLAGTECTLTATANAGYTFINWTCNGEIVSTEPNYSFTVTGAGAYVAHFEQANVTQTIAFPVTGTSTSFWFSTYIEMDPVQLLEALEDALGEDGNEIKYKNSVTSWDEDEEEWDGGLQAVGITNDKTYMIKTNAAVTVTLEGPASNPEDYEILLYPGWNWIGFPCAMEVDIEDAFANFIPMAGDQIKSKDTVAAWDEEEEEWSGGMSKLIPGTGYMFYNASNTTRTLTFQKGTAKAK